MKMHFLLLVLFALLTGCGGGNQKSQTKIAFTQQFAGADFDGGLLLTAENASLNKKYAFALSSSDEITLNLEFGNWKFTVVGYAGNTSGKFSGTTYCGTKTQNLDRNVTVVDIAATLAKCSDFTASYELKETISTVCGNFKSYFAPTDSFTPYAATDYNYCDSLPQDMQSSRKFYRFFGLNVEPGKTPVVASNFKSSCLQTTDAGLTVPGIGFPLSVRTYRTATDCASERDAIDYKMVKGLRDGNKDFEHEFNVAAKNFLVLPGTETKKGRSPFLAEIPRILCGATDCAPDSSVISSFPDFNVSWKFDTHDTRLMKNVSVSSCPANLMANSKFFNLTNCSVSEGDIRASVSRNELTCQSAIAPHNLTSVRDVLYKRPIGFGSEGDRVYVLHNKAGNSVINVYFANGILEHTETLVAPNDFKTLAVTNVGHIFVGGDTRLLKISFSGTHYTHNPASDIAAVAGIRSLEISPNSTVVYVAQNGSQFIQSYNALTNPFNATSVIDTFDAGTALLISDLTVVGSHLYYSADGSPNIFKNAINTGSQFPTTSSTFINTGVTVSRFSYDLALNQMYVANPQTGGQVKIYDFNSPATPLETGVVTGMMSLSGMAAHGGRFFFADSAFSDHLPIKKNNFSGVLVSDMNPSSGLSSGTCSENLTLTAGSRTQAMQFFSTANAPAYDMLNRLYESVGVRRLPESAKTFFTNLNDHGDSRIGGHLSDVQKMLDAHAAGGAFSEFASCLELKAAALSNGGTLSRTLNVLSERGPQTFRVTATAFTAPNAASTIPHYLCEDSNPYTATCTLRPYYDLRLYGARGDSSEGEILSLKLACQAKVGELESYEYGDETHRSLLLWNTTDQTKSRFELFEYSDEDSENQARMAKFQKTSGSTFNYRKVSMHEQSSNGYASISEVTKNAANVLSSQYDVFAPLYEFNSSNTGNTEFNNNSLTFGAFSDSTNLAEFSFSNAQACFTGLLNLTAGNTTTCNHSAFGFSTSRPSLSLKVHQLNDIDTPTPAISSAFSLTK